ncbi:zinc finger protein 583-like isoform X3 [Trichoplusia ni]|uniref:Zinc finger protein 583-like isoform X3 n=1 Tax=Trichoplusia ni TaxID=7111 RepID=A0A7E5WT45_TRINI|nr:zinc finger protein 583-like isoform X3 [Trichoplusia ni]
MSEVKNEIATYFGRCKCCLSYGYLKNMWTEHQFEGESEVYGEMLVDCFALTWDSSESIDQDQICEQCVNRLRDACDFKKIVLTSQEDFYRQLGDGDDKDTIPKLEDCDEEYLMVYKEADSDTADTADTDTADMDVSVNDASACDEEYEDVEYLEDEVGGDAKEALVATSSTQAQKPKRRRKADTPTDSDDGVKRKWPKRLPKNERFKTYKQYTEENLRQCLEAVRSGEITPNDAARKYNIPKKTICAKMRLEPTEEADSNREKTFRLVREIKAILTYTNATPYKSKSIRYYCAYCSTDGPNFEDPDDLRSHTRTEHIHDRIEKIEYAMRPYWMNEVLKLDIDNLLCTVCCIVINNWNEMFRHLREKHNVHLDQAYTRVIPYVLRSDLQCALCKESFSNYMHLDGHMNAHYNNYVCDDCGVTFLAQNRLKQHVKIHNIGKYPCSMCKKVFSLEKYRRKHEETVHKQMCKFKCLYCPEKFTGEYVRHLHCLEAHKDKVKTITCEQCGKVFTWRQYYMNHMKKKHDNIRNYECDECDKKFFSNYELKDHVLRHIGKKNYECGVCHKKYYSMLALKQHGKQHRKDEKDDN